MEMVIVGADSGEGRPGGREVAAVRRKKEEGGGVGGVLGDNEEKNGNRKGRERDGYLEEKVVKEWEKAIEEEEEE